MHFRRWTLDGLPLVTLHEMVRLLCKVVEEEHAQGWRAVHDRVFSYYAGITNKRVNILKGTWVEGAGDYKQRIWKNCCA